MLSAIVVSVVGFILLYVGWEWLRSESQGGIFKKCVNSQAVYPLSEQHGLEAQERR